jgi:ferredoxin
LETIPSLQAIRKSLVANVKKLQADPALRTGELKYALDREGEPDVKVAAANVPLDYDLWKDLRNPAGLGLHPAGLRELWEFYAWRTACKRHDDAGRETIFAVPRSFEEARDRFRRALIVSVMLPFDEKLLRAHARFIARHERGAFWPYSQFYEEVNNTLDKALLRTGMDLTGTDNVVLAMDRKAMDDLSEQAFPLTYQGKAHGPQKEVHYPQKSLAVLTGLAQFGVSRFVFRDEVQAGKVKRFLGPIRSLVLFDSHPPIENGSQGIIYPRQRWRDFLFSLSDFTKTQDDINRCRFCTYIPLHDKGCGKCIPACPPGALLRSVPDPLGRYSEDLHEPKRFWKGQLQFDHEQCLQDRKSMATLFPEWRCGRCITICAAAGNRRAEAVKNYEAMKRKLTVQSGEAKG